MNRARRTVRKFQERSFGAWTIALLLFAGLPATARAQVEPDTSTEQLSFKADNWHISASPYLWFAGLDGNLTLLGHQAAVHQSFGDILSNIKVGFMGLAEVRRGRFGVVTDLLYIRVGDELAVPVAGLPSGVNLRATSNTFTLTPELAYRLYDRKRFSADYLIGVRYYHLDANINVNAGAVGQASYRGANDWADVIQGARLQIRLSRKVGAFFIGDVGAGGSNLTWQIATGVGYRLTPRATLQFGYRRLYFDRHDGMAFGLDNTQEGLLLGTTFRFK